MDRQPILTQVISILKPYVKNQDALAQASEETSILNALQVNSARLVDIILAMEDEFDIEIDDDQADTVQTLKDAVDVIMTQQAA